MTTVRAHFDALWPRLEVWGLRMTALWIGSLALAAIIGNVDSSDVGKLLGYSAAAAAIVAAVLTWDRSREDLVTWVVAGIAGVILVAAFADPHNPAYPPVLVYLGIALFGIRAFRGAFRRRRE